MKKLYPLLLLLLCVWLLPLSAQQYTPDVLGPGFEQRTFHMADDYEGNVISTLIRKRHSNNVATTRTDNVANTSTNSVATTSTDTVANTVANTNTSDKAVLYVHGYNDYFFQKEMAMKFDSAGYNFYAVDLRKYGRSKLASQYPFNVRSLDEYFADIDSAICVIRQEGNREIVLMGHSTGGLISSMYAEHNRAHLQVDALILNSPFLDMNQSAFKERILIPLVSFIGRWFPNLKIPQGISTGYAESLLKKDHGEWEFNTQWKMPISPSLTAGWMRAIYTAQKQIRKGLHIPVPVLVLHSDKSIYGDDWTPAFNTGDAVLDVKDIDRYGRTLGKNVSVVTIPNGLHDLVLSNPTSRALTYRDMFSFLKQNGL